MRRNRIEDADMTAVAEDLGISVEDVRKVVSSFFDSLAAQARKLPFDNESRIYSKDRFEDFVKVFSVPSIGRFGPVYSRYLKWRGNEAKEIEQAKRSDYRSRMTQDDIENIAEDILAGRTPVIRKKKKNELFKQVWLVGKNGKRLAWQVIPKK
jgi:hypothetical protein